MSAQAKHTPGPWSWAGEDYRGGWGWQLLVGPNGEGIVCGEGRDGPYKQLRAWEPIDPKYCKTGFDADADSAPCVHVQQADATLIAAAPELLDALRTAVSLAYACILMPANGPEMEACKRAIAKAEGLS